MCDQTEIVYGDGEVVWVKLGPTWWPGQVLDKDKAPPEALNSFRKPPIAVVKFFKEEYFEFVRNYNQIYKYNCNRKHEFIKKGLDQFRAKHPHMELFPSYVCEAETLTHGDPDIINSEEFKPAQKLDYNAIFSSGSEKKAAKTPKSVTPSKVDELFPRITHPRILQKYLKGISDYRSHILVQDGRKEDGDEDDKIQLEAEEETMIPPPAPTPPRTPATPGPFTCYACPYTTNRISVMVLHNKTHSASYVPYTPPKKPKVRQPQSTPKIKLSPKSFLSKKSRGRPKKISLPETKSSPSPKLVKSPAKSVTPVKRKAKEKEEEKPKTDLEIKNSLLADWSESSNDSFDILSSVNLCEKPKPPQSPTPNSPKSDSVENDKTNDLDENLPSKQVETKKADCFDFDDDDVEDLPIESIGRKIPRLSTKSDDSKKIIDLNAELLEASNNALIETEENKMEMDLDSKIQDLLKETKLPQLPSLPTDNKFIKSSSPPKDEVEENDKKESVKPQQKTIFKTKTFFRSRHSRSQDAIEKYVADNTSIDKPPTYMEEAEQVEVPEDVSTVTTPPSKGSQNKTPKFAPKIQLKKLKAALNEQIKPQVGKSKEDRWDDDSLEKLISTSSNDDDVVPSTHSTINDLLGTVEEEPLPVPQKESIKSPVVKQIEIEDKPSITDTCDTKAHSHNTSDDKQIVSDVNMEESESKDVANEPFAIPSAEPKDEEQTVTSSKENSPQKTITEDPAQNSSISSTVESISSPITTKVTRSPRKVSPRKGSDNLYPSQSELLFSIDSEQNASAQFSKTSDVVSTSSEEIPPLEILQTSSKDDENSAIVEVKGADLLENVASEVENIPSESDLQIAETLINLPTSGVVSHVEFTTSSEDVKMSESDKNISAAKSLVQMSEALQLDQPLLSTNTITPVVSSTSSPKSSLSKSVCNVQLKEKPIENTKLFKILDEPPKPRHSPKIINTKSSEVITNFQMAPQPVQKPRVIIRKGAPPKEAKKQIILQSPIKTVQPPKEDDSLFDINSMPIVLSEEILTPENIQKMPIVVSDVPITPKTDVSPVVTGKVVIKESIRKNDSPSPIKKYGADVKTSTIVKPAIEKSTTPNILSKSNKVKTLKHVLVIDKNSGEQKIITSETFEEAPAAGLTKVVKKSPAFLSKTQKPGEKFIILPPVQSQKATPVPQPINKPTAPPTKITQTLPKPTPGRKTQKIILTPHTGPQLVLEDPTSSDSKPKVTTTKAKIIQNKSGSSEPTGNAYMIITNAQGYQSKILLTPEHQKVLFSKKPGQLTVTAQGVPQVIKSVVNVPTPRAKPIAVTSQSIITSRGQIINPISGNALITSTGQLLPAQTSLTSSSPAITPKQKGSIISSTKVIPPGERVIITGKPNQTILTSKGQLIMTQMAPTTNQAKITSTPTKFTTTTITSSQIAPSPSITKTVVGKPKQTIMKMTSSPTIIKSNSKLISGDLATLLQGKKPGTVMHLSAAQFELLQKTGQIIQQPSLTQIVQSPKAKPATPKVQSQKIIVQKQTPKQMTTLIEKKVQPTPPPRSVPSLVQTSVSTPPPKKQKLRELLSTEADTSQSKKKKILTAYTEPPKQTVKQPKPAETSMDLGNLDDLIPATTIATRKPEAEGEITQVTPQTTIVDSSAANVSNIVQSNVVQEQSLPSTSMQVQEPVPSGDTTQPAAGGLGDGQLLAVPGENFGGPPNSFYLCVEDNGTLTPIDNQPLVLENNQLVPMVIPPVLPEFLNTEEQILVDQQTLLSLLGGSGGDRLVTGDNQQLLLQGDVRQLMAALTPQTTPNQDILAAALADTDVFQPDTLVPEGLGVVSGAGQGMLVEMDALGGDFQNLNSAVAVHSNVSETSTTLKQPIMSPVEIPSKKRITEEVPNTESLEDSLAVIGVTPPSVPSSLDLPITVTDPRIAPKTTNPLSLSCGPLYATPTLVLSPTPSTMETFSSSIITDNKITDEPSSNLKISELIQISSKITDTPIDSIQGLKKQPASSMPCLDDSSSDSFASDNPQQLTEAIQTKTYSPISMPLLTDDPPLSSEAPENSSIDPPQGKSMPVLLDPEESSTNEPDTSAGVDTNMPLLDDSQEEISQESNEPVQEPIVEKEDATLVPDNEALPKEIFNESNDAIEKEVEKDKASGDVDCEIDQTEKVIENEVLEEQHSNHQQQQEEEIAVQSEALVDNVPSVDETEPVTTPQVVEEPVDGIPILVTTEDGEPEGAIVDVDLDVAPPSVPSPPEGNSLPHVEDHFSDASSDVSTEIPLQPQISVSQQSLSAGSNGDHEKRPASANSLDSSPKRFKYDDER